MNEHLVRLISLTVALSLAVSGCASFKSIKHPQTPEQWSSALEKGDLVRVRVRGSDPTQQTIYEGKYQAVNDGEMILNNARFPAKNILYLERNERDSYSFNGPIVVQLLLLPLMLPFILIQGIAGLFGGEGGGFSNG